MRWLAVIACTSVASAAPKHDVLAKSAGREVAHVADDVVLTNPTGSLQLVHTDANETLSASAERFLGNPKLLLVTVSRFHESGHDSRSYERRFVVDTSGKVDAIACAFDGDTHEVGEYARSTTTIVVKKVAATPLTFDVTSMWTHSSTQPQPGSTETSTTTRRYAIGAASCTP